MSLMAFGASLGTFAGDFTQYSLVFLHFVVLISPLHHHPLILLPQLPALVFLSRVIIFDGSPPVAVRVSIYRLLFSISPNCPYHEEPPMSPVCPDPPWCPISFHLFLDRFIYFVLHRGLFYRAWHRTVKVGRQQDGKPTERGRQDWEGGLPDSIYQVPKRHMMSVHV